MQLGNDIKNGQNTDLYPSEKICIINELANGVAHEIKNPLTTTIGLLQLIKERNLEDKLLNQHIDVALEETSKINSIIKELMHISQPSRPDLTFTQIEFVLDEVSLLIDSDAVFNNVTVKRYYQPHLPLAVMDVNQIKRVFINLAVNAINAMPGGGLLEINVTYNQEQKKFKIDFKDNGKGISKTEIKKIFYPFYSDGNEKIGLGLTVSEQLVSKHGGQIKVTSEKGKGSIFTVHLPVVNTN